jgi:putative ABC transport system permease protein
MTPIDIVLSALSALRANILRTFLTMLGVIIGVAAVIVLTAATEGAQQGITERIRGLGSDLMFVRPAETRQGGVAGLFGPSLFYEDALAIGDAKLDCIEAMASHTAAGGGQGLIALAQVIYRGQNTGTVLIGTEPSYQFVRDFYVENGRFLSEDDVEKKALVVVLGASVADKLFGEDDPVGETVRVFAGLSQQFGVGFNFTVIGVMERKGATGSGDEDDRVFVPLPSFQARVPLIRNPRGYSNVSQISIKLSDRGASQQCREDIGIILRDLHSGNDDFTIQTQSEVLNTATDIDRELQVLVFSIALIALIVGGIGIMNIMLVSVTERTREIGIRKALGAKRMDILWQFLIEALVVTMLGGAIGVLSGWVATEVAVGFDIGGSDQKYVVTPFWIIVGLVVSAATGLVAGVYPAWRAARLDPIEALRHE